MAKIIHIETTGENCSVALSEHGKIINLKEHREGKSHASKLAVFIDQILKEEAISIQQLDAVSISKGPGSYTGLRIGVSTAKGLCYGADIPLVSVHTLQALSQHVLEHSSEYGLDLDEKARLVPLIDARRMEVYSAMFDLKNTFIRDVHAEIIEETSYQDVLENHQLVFFGNGTEKCKKVISHPNAIFIDGVEFSATNMVRLSEVQFQNQTFEDVAYFEPFYLKDFRTTTPRKGLF